MLTFRITCIFFVSLLIDEFKAYSILAVFPLPSKSHSILGDAFVNTLLNAGHEVTYITPTLISKPLENLRQIDVSSNFNILDTEAGFNMEMILKKEMDLLDISLIFQIMIALANNTLMNKSVQNLLHSPKTKFDAVIVEWMYTELYSGFSTVFDCPLIWSSSMDPHYLVMSLIDEDLNPSYTADVYTVENPPFNFVQRVFKLWSYFLTRYKKWLVKPLEIDIYEKAYSSAVAKRGRSLPNYEELARNGSLMFGNSHVSSGQSIRLPQNYIPIGGYHISSDVKPLPKDLKIIMDEAEHGVIYFSMGSVLKSKHVPDEIKRGIMNVFAGLKQTVIWKFEEQLLNKSENLHIVNWAPQPSILAHPNCVLFITHGGLLSITESLHFRVPIIGIPIFADQYNNVNRAVNKGFGLRVDLSIQTPVSLKEAIEKILGNPRYLNRVKELSFVHHHRPVLPGAELLHWVEHVVRTRGAPHLRSPSLMLPWYQKMYLDLLAAVVLIVLLFYWAVKLLCSSTKKIGDQKKEN